MVNPLPPFECIYHPSLNLIAGSHCLIRSGMHNPPSTIIPTVTRDDNKRFRQQKKYPILPNPLRRCIVTTAETTVGRPCKKQCHQRSPFTFRYFVFGQMEGDDFNWTHHDQKMLSFLHIFTLQI